MEKYDIFLSYRRDGGWETAQLIYDRMKNDCYSVSFDINNLREGRFDTELLRRIDQCTDFIVILDEHVFDKTLDKSCKREDDWLRRELAHALEKGKNIIPVMLEGFRGFPDNLPHDIKNVSKHHGLKLDKYYFDAFYDEIKKRIKSSPRSAISFIKNNLENVPHYKKIFGISLTILFLCLILITISKSENKELVKTITPEEMCIEAEKYYFGDGVTKDYNKAVYWFFKAAEKGYVNAMNALGVCYNTGNGVAKDYKQAMYWYQQAAVRGNTDAMSNIGALYHKGLGVALDYNKAVYWYQKAAENGNITAMSNLGICYKKGEGIVQNLKQAVYWFQKASLKGEDYAMYSLGYCYEKGEGIAQDFKQAVYWYQQAANNGNFDAMCSLGYCYDIGNGVAQDYKQAVYWYKKAAEKGNIDAMNNLGLCYENGKGVTQSQTIADKLFKAKELAQTGGEARAIEMVKEALK